MRVYIESLKTYGVTVLGYVVSVIDNGFVVEDHYYSGNRLGKFLASLKSKRLAREYKTKAVWL